MKVIRERYTTCNHQNVEEWINKVILNNKINEADIISISMKNESSRYGGYMHYMYYITIYVREL